jgi:hypothetical protein
MRKLNVQIGKKNKIKGIPKKKNLYNISISKDYISRGGKLLQENKGVENYFKNSSRRILQNSKKSSSLLALC